MNNQIQKTILRIKGTRCKSCELLIADAFKSLPGIEDVAVNHRTGLAEIHHSLPLKLNELEKSIFGYGYTVAPLNDVNLGIGNSMRDYVEIGISAVIIAVIYGIFRIFNLLPDDLGVNEAMSYWMIFGLGLVAAVSTCIAATGGLLLAISARYAEKYPTETISAKFVSHIYFNAGRLISYAVFGGIIGAIGSSLTISPFLNGLLVVFVSLIMIALGLKMLRLMPSIGVSVLPKVIVEKIYDFGKKKSGAFLAGASTFFLPCGFTQALQIYVLSSGDAVYGAMVMLIFALGTLPVLMTLGAVASFSNGVFRRYFINMAGVAVLIFGFLNVGNGMNLTGINFSNLRATVSSGRDIEVVAGSQIARMKVIGLDYEPSQFTVKVGRPVGWLIDGSGALGCARVIVAPKIGLREILQKDKIKKITFTPKSVGKISFSCSMGMTTPGAAFNVVK